MSSSNTPNPWSDRRGMFQKGKEVHQPTSPTGRRFFETGVGEAVRRASIGSMGDSTADKANAGGNEIPTASQPRRRSSAASGGMFGNLTNMKRGSEDYSQRRSSQTEMLQSGGRVSGWFNQTFKGIQKPTQDPSSDDKKRGVME